MSKIAFDIETVESERADEFFEKGYAKPSARLKDPEKIAKDLCDKRAKCGLYWWTGKVVGICAFDILETNPRKFYSFGDNEVSVLHQFRDYLENMDLHPTLIGKNSKTFDVPYLVGRYMANNLVMPSCLMIKIPGQLQDVDEMFAPYGTNGQVTSLDNYAFGLGIDGKLVKNGGSQVKNWYDEGKWDLIEKYCEQDVNIVAEMYRRYRPY